MGRARPIHVPNVRAALGKKGGPGARHLRAHETRPHRALRDPRAEDRRHPARGRPDLPTERHDSGRASVRALRRRDPAAQGPADGNRGACARRRRPAARARRRREARRRRGAKRNRAARPRAARRARRATSSTRGSPRSTAAQPASSFRRATRGSGCPCSSRWPPGRRSSRAGPARCPRWPAMRRCSSSRATRRRSPRASAQALADRDRFVAAGLERAKQFTWAETARRTLEVYRELM